MFMGYVAYVLHCKELRQPEAQNTHVTIINFNNAMLLDVYLKNGSTDTMKTICIEESHTEFTRHNKSIVKIEIILRKW
jgi:hypothetical protein